jgi:uncharacterized membrane protein
MEDSLAEQSQEIPQRRRRKSSKQAHEEKRRRKVVALWLLLGLVGVILVTAIAVYAGSE